MSKLLFGGKKIYPFLRWAGSKRHNINKLIQYLPEDVFERRYIEPFVGAGSMFLTLQPTAAFLSDANEHLINSYKYVSNKPDLIHKYLLGHKKKSGEAYYYRIREIYNSSEPSAAQAARFIYLNQTCFNGIFRVNKKGEFNVAYGWKEPPILPTLSHLRNLSKALNDVKITACSFEKALWDTMSNDFIYLDPPYPPLNGTSNFTHYTTDRFSKQKQMELYTIYKKLDLKGCKLMMSNADVPFIRDLYNNFNINWLSVVRWITCKNKKHRVSEVIITNYSSFLEI